MKGVAPRKAQRLSILAVGPVRLDTELTRGTRFNRVSVSVAGRLRSVAAKRRGGLPAAGEAVQRKGIYVTTSGFTRLSCERSSKLGARDRRKREHALVGWQFALLLSSL
jgi:hypothetical protein